MCRAAGAGADPVRTGDILNWCRENKCGKYPAKCAGVNHPALCPNNDKREEIANVSQRFRCTDSYMKSGGGNFAPPVWTCPAVEANILCPYAPGPGKDDGTGMYCPVMVQS